MPGSMFLGRNAVTDESILLFQNKQAFSGKGACGAD